MRKYYILPEGCKWTETEAANAEAAFSAVCCWHNIKTRIAVIDAETGQAAIFNRKIDSAGNLQEITQHL